MSIIATAVRHLMAAGVTGEALIDAIAEMEAAQPKDAVAEKRRAYDRERKASKRAEVKSGGSPVESADIADIADKAPLSLPLSPQTPLTPTHTPGIKTRARKGPNDLAAKPAEVSEAVWIDFNRQRKKPFTDTALRGLKREADKAGWTLEAAIEESTLRGWEGFKADWVKDKQNGQRSQLSRPTTRQLGERAAARLAGANDCAPDGLPRLSAPGGHG